MLAAVGLERHLVGPPSTSLIFSWVAQQARAETFRSSVTVAASRPLSLPLICMVEPSFTPVMVMVTVAGAVHACTR